MRHYSLPAIPRHVGAWGPLSLGLSVCGSVLPLPHRGHGLFSVFVVFFLNYTLHTQRSLWYVYFSTSWMLYKLLWAV